VWDTVQAYVLIIFILLADTHSQSILSLV